MSVEQPLTSLSRAAALLEVDRRTIGDLVRAHEIPTYRMAGTALAKGVDKAGLKRLAKLLNRRTILSA